MFCTKCGEKLEENAKFCTNCGATVEEVKEEKKTKTTKKEPKEVKEEPKAKEKVEEKEEVKEEKKTVDTGVKIDGKPVVIEKPQEDGKATASLVLGICSIVVFCLSFPLSLIGLILGIVSKERSGKRTAGIVINAIVLGLTVIVGILFGILVATGSAIVEDVYEDYKDEVEKEIKDKDIDIDIDIKDKDKEVKEDTKYVGDDTYGYVQVPKKWVEFVDVSGTDAIQYTDIGDKGYIVTLNVIKQDVSDYDAAKAINDGIKNEGATSYYISATIGGYKGYVVKGSYTDGTKIDSYIFKTEDGVLRFVSIEGPDRYNENFDIPKTFTLKK